MSWKQVDDSIPVFEFSQEKPEETPESVWDEMAVAYREGVQEA